LEPRYLRCDTRPLNLGFRDGKLAVVESDNRAGDHVAAKRTIGTTKTLTPEEAADQCSVRRGLRSGRRSDREAIRIWSSLQK
jgi:hypothetical protein